LVASGSKQTDTAAPNKLHVKEIDSKNKKFFMGEDLVNNNQI
jgi:hypothetical protein